MRLRLGMMAHTFNPKTEEAKADKTGFCRFEVNQHSEFLQASQGLHSETYVFKKKKYCCLGLTLTIRIRL